MIKFLLVIFFMFLILLLLMGFSVIRTFKKLLFGSGDSNRSSSRRGHSSGRSQSDNVRYEDESQRSSKRRKKIFAKDEGEYVDYEEVE